MFTRVCSVVISLVAMAGAGHADVRVPVAATEQPETVMATFRPKAGSEDALARTIARHFETASSLHLLRDDMPYVTVRGTDETQKAYFVDIFTWRDAAAPDTAPAPIQAIWKEM